MVKTFESLVLSKYWTLTGKLFSVLLVSILITGEARADSAPVANVSVVVSDASSVESLPQPPSARFYGEPHLYMRT